MLDIMYEIPSRTDVMRCHITEDTIKEKKQPELEFLPQKLELAETVTLPPAGREAINQ